MDIAELLRSLYEIKAGSSSLPDDPAVMEMRRILAIYREGALVECQDVLADKGLGVVLTRETHQRVGSTRTWNGVHVWRFRGSRCVRFEAYGQALIVLTERPWPLPETLE
jgi:hypothetical protein